MNGDLSAIHLYVWDDRFLYLGPGMNTTLHRNHAAVWLCVAQGKVRSTLADGTVLEDEVVYLPSGTEYATEWSPTALSTPLAALFWEPESASYRRVAVRLGRAPRQLACRHRDADAWALLQSATTTLQDANTLLARIFGFDADELRAVVAADRRIAVALRFLRESPEKYQRLETLAEMAHLSPSRFAHLFKQEVGVPVRRYVLWMKMRRALDLAIAGDSLTTAALSAGFADSAHLSRTVRAMLGIAPEFLSRHRERLVVHH